MKKDAREWEQKYYKEKARSIRILHINPMKIANITQSTKPELASKVESSSNTGNKGKEVVRERMQISDDDRSNSIKTNDELPISDDVAYRRNFW